MVSTMKIFREVKLIDSYKLLKEGKEIAENEIFLASALGWCIEWGGKYPNPIKNKIRKLPRNIRKGWACTYIRGTDPSKQGDVFFSFLI
nr:farnesyl pyrophosphate synthase 1 [Ipomoea batatas]